MPIVSITEEAEKLIIRLKGLLEFETGEVQYRKDVVESALSGELFRQQLRPLVNQFFHSHEVWSEQKTKTRKTLIGRIRWLFKHPPEPSFSEALGTALIIFARVQGFGSKKEDKQPASSPDVHKSKKP